MVAHGVDGLTAVAVGCDEFTGFGRLCVRYTVTKACTDAYIIVDRNWLVTWRRNDLFDSGRFTPRLFIRIENDVVHFVLTMCKAGRYNNHNTHHLHQIRR